MARTINAWIYFATMRNYILALIVAVFGVAAFAQEQKEQKSEEQKSAAGPLDFVVKDIDGKDYDLSQLKGKAVLINPTHCIGHGACAAACPHDASTLVFGTEKRGMDSPQVSPTFETNVPNLFIAGGAVAGRNTGNIFIENGRFHGERIINVLVERLPRD